MISPSKPESGRAATARGGTGGACEWAVLLESRADQNDLPDLADLILTALLGWWYATGAGLGRLGGVKVGLLGATKRASVRVARIAVSSMAMTSLKGVVGDIMSPLSSVLR